MWIKETLEYLLKVFIIWKIILPWETGIRVRIGKDIKILNKGIHFRIPYFDSIYVQQTRLRVVDMPIQTTTTKDGHTITFIIAAGYEVTDILKLYNALHRPESTLSNMIMGSATSFVNDNNLSDIKPQLIEDCVMDVMSKTDYGIKFAYSKLLGFSVVKTFRLIQDQHWSSNQLNIEQKS